LENEIKQLKKDLKQEKAEHLTTLSRIQDMAKANTLRVKSKSFLSFNFSP